MKFSRLPESVFFIIAFCWFAAASTVCVRAVTPEAARGKYEPSSTGIRDWCKHEDSTSVCKYTHQNYLGDKAQGEATGGEVYATNDESLGKIIAEIGQSVATVVISHAKTITGSQTVPPNITLKFVGEGKVSISAGQTLTIKGPLQATARRIFDGKGIVRFTGNSTLVDIYPQWWGARGDFDGVTQTGTDNTSSLQAAFDAAKTAVYRKTYSRRVVIPAGIYMVTGTLVLSDVRGVEVVGSGMASVIQWRGGPHTPLFYCPDLKFSSFKNLHIKSEPGMPLAVAFKIENGAGGMWNPSNVHWEQIIIDGGNRGGLNKGIQFALGKGGDNNNDFHALRHVIVSYASAAAFSIEASQEYQISFIDCEVYASARGVATDLGSGGNFNWYGGFCGGASVCFSLGPPNSSPIAIRNVGAENSKRLLVTAGPASSIHGVLLDGIRWANDQGADDGVIIDYRFPGPLTILNSRLGQYPKKPFKISWGFDAKNWGGRAQFHIGETVIEGSLSGLNEIFAIHRPTSMQSVWYKNGTNYALLGDTFRVTSVSGQTPPESVASIGLYDDSSKEVGLRLTPAHIISSATDSDIAGQLVMKTGTTTTKIFTRSYGSAPVCVVTPTSDLGAGVRFWVTTTATAMTLHVSSAVNATFNYICVGNGS